MYCVQYSSTLDILCRGGDGVKDLEPRACALTPIELVSLSSAPLESLISAIIKSSIYTSEYKTNSEDGRGDIKRLLQQ